MYCWLRGVILCDFCDALWRCTLRCRLNLFRTILAYHFFLGRWIFFGRIFCEKFCENGKLYVTLQRLRREAPRLGITIVLWCNGSTTVFGSVCLGSNPGKTTIREEGNLKAAWPNGFFLLFCRRVVSEFYTGLSRGIYGTISGYGLLFVPTLPRPSI